MTWHRFLLLGFALFLAEEASAQQESTFKVSPGSWVATGIQIRPNQYFDISASGTLKHPNGRESGPDGYYWLGFQAWTLKYKLGETGPNEGIVDVGTGGLGYGGEKGGQLYLGVSATYDPVPAESVVTGSLTVVIVRGESSSAELQGSTKGDFFGSSSGPGTPPDARSSSGEGRRRGPGLLIPGLIPPLIVGLVNGRDLVNKWRKRRRRAKPQDPPSKKPKSLPEEPPFVRNNPRDQIPEPCRQHYDEYVELQREIVGMEEAIRNATSRYWEAQRRHNMNLAKFTLLLGWDTGDLVAAGTTGVLGAKGLADLIHQVPDMLRKGLQLARTAMQNAARRVAKLTEQLAELTNRIKTLGKHVDELASGGKAVGKAVEDLAGAISTAEKRIAEQLRFLQQFDHAEGLLAQRNLIAQEISQRQSQLQKARDIMDGKMRRRTEIGDRKTKIGSDASDLGQQIANLEAEILNTETQAAAKTSQKLNPLRKVDAEIRDIEKRIRNKEVELPKRKQEFLEREESLLQAEENYTREFNKAQEIRRQIGEHEDKAKILSDAERAIESHKLSKEALHQSEYDYSGALGRRDAFLETLPVDEHGALAYSQFTPAQINQLKKLEMDVNVLEGNLKIEKNLFEQAKFELMRAKLAAEQMTEAVDARAGNALIQLRNEADARVKTASAAVEKERLAFENAGKHLHTLSHPGMDLDTLPGLKSKLEPLKQQRQALQREFDTAYDAEQSVKQTTQTQRQNVENLKNRQNELDTESKKLDSEAQSIADDEQKFVNSVPEIEAERQALLTKEKELEGSLTSARDQVPSGATRDSLQKELEAQRAALVELQRKQNVPSGISTPNTPLDDARQMLAVAQTEKTIKFDELEGAKNELTKAEQEVQRLETEAAKHTNQPDWIDRARQTSKEWSDWAKPGVVKSFEDWFKKKMSHLGDLRQRAVGGQSPEEIAKILSDGVRAVQRLLDEMNALLDERQALMEDLRTARAQLEYCRLQHGPKATTP